MQPTDENVRVVLPILKFLILLSAALRASALVPIQCVGNVTRPNAVCCPLHPANRMVCGGMRMGSCDRVIAPVEYIPTVFHVDDRVAWPTRFFSYSCQCKDNFYGTACESCWFGWEGKLCNVRKTMVRKDIRKLSQNELAIFIDVVRRSLTWPSGYAILNEEDNWHSDPLKSPEFEEASIQYFITFLHRYGSRTTLYKNVEDCEMYGILDFNHDGITFPTWHRYFMLIWERLLGQIAYQLYGVTAFTIPYWDWIGMRECDICNNRFIGAPGRKDSFGLGIDSRHPFYNMTDFCYEPEDGMLCYGCQKAKVIGRIAREWNSLDFPNQDNFDFVMSRKHYFVPGERDSKSCESFHMALEGFCGEPGSDGSMLWTHNKIHNMIDGSMCCTATASNDPMFILHHTLMDKIFHLWYRKYRPSLDEYPNKGVRPGHCRDCFMVGFIPPIRHADMFIDISDVGYQYDTAILGEYAQNGKPPLFF